LRSDLKPWGRGNVSKTVFAGVNSYGAEVGTTYARMISNGLGRNSILLRISSS